MEKKKLLKTILGSHCLLLLAFQPFVFAGNNVSKEYVDNRYNALQLQINTLLSAEAGLMGPPGPRGPMGPPGPPGEVTVTKADDSDNMHAVGEFALGGIVFYVDGSSALGAKGRHGLVASMSDNANDISWNGYSGSSGPYDLSTNAKGNGIGAGRNNTLLIISMQTLNAKMAAKKPLTLQPFAAEACASFCMGEDGITPCTGVSAFGKTKTGYADWYLPSLAELNLMWNLKTLRMSGLYWSSTEDTSTEAYFHSSDGQSFGSKSAFASVRCVRTF